MKGSTNTLVTQTSCVGSAAYPNYNLHTWVHSSLRNPNATYLSSIFCQTRPRTPQLVASAAAGLKRLSSPSALWAFPETPKARLQSHLFSEACLIFLNQMSDSFSCPWHVPFLPLWHSAKFAQHCWHLSIYHLPFFSASFGLFLSFLRFEWKIGSF